MTLFLLQSNKSVTELIRSLWPVTKNTKRTRAYGLQCTKVKQSSLLCMPSCIYFPLSSRLPPPSHFPARPALLIWYGRGEGGRMRMRLTDSGGFLLILPPSVLLAIPLSTHPCPLQQESSCVSVSVSRRAAGGRGGVSCDKTPSQVHPLPPPPSSVFFPSFSFFLLLL